MTMELQPQGGNLLMMPFDMANRGSQYLRQFFAQSAGVFLPSQTPNRHVKQMMQHQSLHEAGLGVSAIHRGERLGQSDLVLMGQLIIANSVVKTDGKGKIPIPAPDDITARVVDIALEEEIYPEVNPYLPVPVLDRTAKVIEKFNPNNVIPLFSRS